LAREKVPEMEVPSRTKQNIVFDEKHRVWKYGANNTTRSARTLDGAMMLLRTMYMADFIKEMIETSKSSTLRELYYISEGWDLGKFPHSQDESDMLAEDLEIITKLLREDFKLRPEEDGASVIGDIEIEEITRDGKPHRIHIQDDVGDSGYNIRTTWRRRRSRSRKWMRSSSSRSRRAVCMPDWWRTSSTPSTTAPSCTSRDSRRAARDGSSSA